MYTVGEILYMSALGEMQFAFYVKQLDGCQITSTVDLVACPNKNLVVSDYH